MSPSSAAIGTSSARLAAGGVLVTLVTNGALLDDAAVERAVAARRSTPWRCRSTGCALRTTGSGRPRIGNRLRRDARRAAARCGPPASAPPPSRVNRWNLDEWTDPRRARRRGSTRSSAGSEFRSDEAGNAEPYMIAPEQLPLLVRRLVALITTKRPRACGSDGIGYYTACEPILRARPRASRRSPGATPESGRGHREQRQRQECRAAQESRSATCGRSRSGRSGPTRASPSTRGGTSAT